MKHLFASLTKLGVIFLCGGLILTACAAFDPRATQEAIPDLSVLEKPSGIVVEGRVVPQEYSNLFFALSGEVIEILVAEGDQVSKGDVLARLGDRESLEARLTAARLELLAAQQAVDDLDTSSELLSKLAQIDLIKAKMELSTTQENLSRLDNDDYQESTDEARIEVTDAEEELKEAQETFEKFKDLNEDSIDRKQAEDELEEAQDQYDAAVRKRDHLINDLDLAAAAVALATAKLEDAQRTVEARTNGPDPDDQALAQARLDNARAQISAIEAELMKFELIAPFNGAIVLVDISVGERALPNQTVMVLADFSTWCIDTSDLSEFDVVSISPGQDARVVPDALPGLSIRARVDKISQTYTERSGDVNYKTRLTLLETDPLLRWGMTVEVFFDEQIP